MKAHVDLKKETKKISGLKDIRIHLPYKASEDRNL